MGDATGVASPSGMIVTVTVAARCSSTPCLVATARLAAVCTSRAESAGIDLDRQRRRRQILQLLLVADHGQHTVSGETPPSDPDPG